MVPDEMQAAVLTGFGGPEVLEVRSVPVPRPGDGEVLVRVAAAALNNTDIWTRQGAYGLPGDPDARAGWRGPVDFPRIQGGDIAGEVVAVGGGVDPARVGRRVLVDPAFYDGPGPDARPVGLLGSEADGGFAGYAVAADERAHDVTDSPLTDDELAALPVAYGTAAGMLARGGIAGGETVLVTGASGGVGLAAVQLAAARGARVVAITAAGKEEAVREGGAAEVVLRDRDPAAVADAVGRVAGRPLDAVVDVVGGPLLPALLDRVRDGGRWVIAGAIGGARVDLDLRRLYLHNVALVGSSMHTPAHFAELVADAVAGRVRPRIAGRRPLSAIHEAQEEFARAEHVGKIVVHPG
ncbi:zinc-binding dehydrogenase [Actinomycetospora cinnamomea]|uniref:NADPH:quinone reductase-like Zn-dependent oxidoreductase n=1 Tax=Actinomycetospora cinnamomea TaxID=663609 RepID=A0A2U1FKZ3_9PSEU|nr:zinc-binding dehydrogenase [Actinomycetospora cinnamomea]PVZ12854.1 NADPH:quinone reductase-like Zn-dependent oxidoreductase [Actinomycetospora cinnamomea]